MARGNEFNDEVVDILSGSGLRIAETLEIHDQGATWWNLINHTQEIGAKVPSEVRISGGVVEPGVIHLDSAAVSHDFTAGQSPLYMGLDENEEPLFIKVVFDSVTAGKISVFFYDSMMILRKSFSAIYSSGAYPVRSFKTRFGIWDNTNKRLVLNGNSTYYTSSNLYFMNLDVVCDYASGNISFFSSSSVSENGTWILSQPGKSLIAYFETGQIKFKFVEPTLSESASNYAARLRGTAGAEILSIAQDPLPGQIHTFYSQAISSFGILWVDGTTGRVFYALESEGWAIANEILSFNSSGKEKILAAGCLPISETGEYLGLYKELFPAWETVTRPSGYAFPANSCLCGSGITRDGKTARIFTRAGDQWVAHSVNLETMTIEASSNQATQLWEWSPPEAFLYEENETRELWVGQDAFWVVDKNTLQIVYGWRDWESSGRFYCRSPWTYQRGSIWKINDKILFWSLASTYNPYLTSEYYTLGASLLLGYDSSSEVTAALNTLDSTQQVVGTKVSWSSRGDLDNAGGIRDRRLVTEDSNAYYFNFYVNNLGQVLSGYTSPAVVSMALNKNDLSLHSITTEAENKNGYNTTIDPHWYDSDGTPRLDLSQLDDRGDAFAHALARHRSGKLDARGGILETNAGTSSIILDTLYGLPVQGLPDEWRSHLHGCGFTHRGRWVGRHYLAHTKSTSDPNNRYALGLWSYKPDTSANAAMDNVIKMWEIPSNIAIESSIWDGSNGNLWLLSGIVDGDIKYLKMNSLSGVEQKITAVNLSNTDDRYDVDFQGSQYGVFSIPYPYPATSTTTPLYSHAALHFYGAYTTVVDTWGDGHVFKTCEIGETVPLPEAGGSGGGAGGVEIIMDNRSYLPYPFKREKISVELSNLQKTLKVALPDTQDDQILQLVASGKDFRGHRCIVRRLFIDADLNKYGSSIVLMDGYIQDWSYRRKDKTVLFSLAHTVIDLRAPFPRRIMSMLCSHCFKGKRCQYAGASVLCPKTLSACETLGNTIHYGGFPWVAARQRRVMFR